LTDLSNVPISVIRYGREEPLPQSRILRAGPLTMLYESGFLRYIRLGDQEVVRMIYHAVRNHQWETVPGVIENEDIQQRADSFHVRYTSRCHADPVDFRWQCEITGEPDGTIQFSINGEALSAFQRNRIGFCVLHPIQECAGQPCQITHPDGTQTNAHFPTFINPHEPFMNIREMQWPVKGGACSAVLWFVGDVFETEDQRNWTDASYKTYCTPQSRPRPVTVRAGDQVQQTVELRLTGTLPAIAPQPAETTVITLNGTTAAPSLALPLIGLSATAEPLDAFARHWLTQARIHHLRVEVDFRYADWSVLYQKAVEEATQLGCQLEIILFFNQLASYELYSFLKEITTPALIYSVVVLSNYADTTPAPLLEQVVAPLRQTLPNALIGAGTDVNFTELNRETPPVEAVDFLSYAIHPQAHAVDNRSVLETPEAQQDTVKTALRWLPRVHVSPITLKPRFNPDATEDSAPLLPNELPDSVDPRQVSLFGAAWTLASLKALTVAQAASITFYETSGEQGILQGNRPPAYADFQARSEMLFPLYWVFYAVNRFRDGQVVPTSSSQPASVDALYFRKGAEHGLLVANLTSEAQTVQIPVNEPVTVCFLSEETYAKACFSPEQFLDDLNQSPNTLLPPSVTLPPYAILLARW